MPRRRFSRFDLGLLPGVASFETFDVDELPRLYTCQRCRNNEPDESSSLFCERCLDELHRLHFGLNRSFDFPEKGISMGIERVWKKLKLRFHPYCKTCGVPTSAWTNCRPCSRLVAGAYQRKRTT